MTLQFNWTLADFDDVMEYIAELIGADFAKAVNLANDIIEHTADYSGVQASISSMRLAAYRTKIGSVAQFYKLKSVETKHPADRLTKDALLVMYDSLEELINTLKLSTRHEMEVLK